MKRKIIRTIARFTVNLCDYMNGYYGKLIEEALGMIAITTPTVFFLMWFMIVMS